MNRHQARQPDLKNGLRTVVADIQKGAKRIEGHVTDSDDKTYMMVMRKQQPEILAVDLFDADGLTERDKESIDGELFL